MEPTTQVERSLVQQMVFAWQDTPMEVRQPITNALLNSGAVPINEIDERVKFDGCLHICEEKGVFPGDKVVVVRPGWMYKKILMACAVVYPVKKMGKPKRKT